MSVSAAGLLVSAAEGLCRTAALESAAGLLCRTAGLQGFAAAGLLRRPPQGAVSATGLLCRPPRGCVRRRPLSWPRGSCVGSCVGRGAALESAAGLLCRTAGRRAHKDGNKNPSANLVDCVSKLACLCRPRGFCVGLRGAVSDGGA